MQGDKLVERFSGHVHIISGLRGTLTMTMLDASTISLAGFLEMHLINCSVSSNALFLQPSSLPSMNARSRAVLPVTLAQGESAVPDWDIAR